eukprot:2665116-Amphidinium_carterae.1
MIWGERGWRDVPFAALKSKITSNLVQTSASHQLQSQHQEPDSKNMTCKGEATRKSTACSPQ